MVDEEYKLSKFQTAVFAEIDAKTAQIKQQAEIYKEHALEENKDKQLDLSYNYIQKKSHDVKKQFKRDVAKSSLDAKRSLLQKRNEITTRIFSNVYARLCEFSNTPEYKKYLIQGVKRCGDNEKLADVEILLRQDDMELASDVKKAYGLSCTVTATNEFAVGGFIVRDIKDGIYIDETLEQKLKEQRTQYIKDNKLAI